MSVVKRIVKDSIERVAVDELLGHEFEQAGYGGITLTKTPLGAQINLFTMRPGRVIGKRGRSIKAASERLELELGLSNPQITVVEVEVPELNPRIMASRIANALERGVHFRRALFWALRRIMDSGALGCEIVLRGKLRSDRSRFEKVGEGYMPKSGDPVIKNLKSATMHVKLKRGTFGVTVNIVPPDAKFPDKISLEGLPEIEVPEEEHALPEGVEPEKVEAEVAEVEALEQRAEEPVEQISETVESKEEIKEPPKESEKLEEESEGSQAVTEEILVEVEKPQEKSKKSGEEADKQAEESEERETPVEPDEGEADVEG
jgi:small subunit ribosomal protein S3